MLDIFKIDQIVNSAATATLKPVKHSRVFTELTTDSDGREALHVTIVLRDNKKDNVSGDLALSTIVRIQHDLRQSGEERFPIIEFATEAELKSNDDP